MTELGSDKKPPQRTAAQEQMLVKTKSVRDYLFSDNILKQLQLALPNSMTPERLARLVLTEVRRIPQLLDCSRDSLIGAVIECAQLGLEPGTMGQAWLIPFKGKATLIIGYRGMLHLMYQSNRVKDVMAACVYQGDVFDWDRAADEITHKPCGENDPQKITHAYSIVRTSNGGRVWDVMTRAELDAIRRRSRSGQEGPWVTDYAEMCKKTVTRRNAKYAPASTRVARAITLDEQADLGLDQGLGESFAEEVFDEPQTLTEKTNGEPVVTTGTPLKTTATDETKSKGGEDFEALSNQGRVMLDLTDAEYKAIQDLHKGDWKLVYQDVHARVQKKDERDK